MDRITVIIPTYNEEKNIFKLTKSLLKILPKSLIYIVDDTRNSKIATILPKKKKIKYYLRKNKRGRGSAVLYGLKKSLKKNNNIFIEMDADFSHNPNEIKKNLIFFKKNKLDLLVSSRYLPDSKILNWGILRRFFSKISNLLAKILLRISVSDYTNGFRIYSRKSAQLIVKKCGNIGDGFIVLSEILLIIYLHKLKIGEVPTIFVNRKRGESSVNLLLIIQSLLGLIKLYFIKKKIIKKNSKLF